MRADGPGPRTWLIDTQTLTHLHRSGRLSAQVDSHRGSFSRRSGQLSVLGTMGHIKNLDYGS